jgi:hypothetical protein
MGHIVRLLAGGLSVALVSGCATSANDHYNVYWTKTSPKTQATYVTETKDWYGDTFKLAYYTDLAISQLRDKSLKNANQSLQAADDIVDDNFKKNYPGMIKAFTISEESGSYSGDPYEQVQIPMLRSLVFAQDKKWENSRAMARRTNDTIQSIVQKIAKAHGFDADLSTEAPKQSGKGDKKSKTAKWHYVKDAFAYYIASAAAYNEGDYENALASARNAVLTYRTSVYQANYLVKEIPQPTTRLYCHLAKTIDKGELRGLDQKLAEEVCKGVPAFDTAKGDAVVVVLHGRGATKQSLTVDIKLDQGVVTKIIAGVAVPLFKAFSASDEENTKDKTASKNVSGGKSSVVYDVLMGAIMADPYISDQIQIQVAELTSKGSKGLGSGLANGVGALSSDVMRLSVPIYLWYPTSNVPGSVTFGKSAVSKISLASNLDGIRERELFDTMNMAMTRSVSRGFFRLGLAEGAGKVGGFWAKLAVGAVTKSAESAETRSLRSFPQAIYATSASLEKGSYPLSGAGLQFTSDKIVVEPNKISFVIAFSGT